MKIIKRRAILVLGLALVVATLALSAFTFAPVSSHADTVHCIHIYGAPWRTVVVPAPAGHWVRHGRFCFWNNELRKI